MNGAILLTGFVIDLVIFCVARYYGYPLNQPITWRQA